MGAPAGNGKFDGRISFHLLARDPGRHSWCCMVLQFTAEDKRPCAALDWSGASGRTHKEN